jgi:Flp pilus assembly pilin Flp
MSDFISTTQTATRDACVALFVGMQSLGQNLAERAKDQKGQTAAEYMGVLFLVAAIIAAIMALHVPDHIANGIKKIVDGMGGTAGADCKGKDC